MNEQCIRLLTEWEINVIENLLDSRVIDKTLMDNLFTRS